jgi:hypothetical protein
MTKPCVFCVVVNCVKRTLTCILTKQLLRQNALIGKKRGKLCCFV